MIPKHLGRTIATQTYFITSSTSQKRSVFQVEAWAKIFLQTLYHYRREGHYTLHSFVLMPDHFHLLITPSPGNTLEKVVQLIKGGSSFRLKQAGRNLPFLWHRGFSDRRVRDAEEYKAFVAYIQRNPVKRGLAEAPELYPYCSAFPGFKLDPVRPYLSG
jgi:putative transposase